CTAATRTTRTAAWSTRAPASWDCSVSHLTSPHLTGGSVPGSWCSCTAATRTTRTAAWSTRAPASWDCSPWSRCCASSAWTWWCGHTSTRTSARGRCTTAASTHGSAAQPYLDPRAPVHVVTGSAGCREGTDGFLEHPRPWSAFRSSDYGYTKFFAHNRTHIYMEQISVEHPKSLQHGEVIDSFWIVKNLHAPYKI
ncbi:hypothetical protein ACJJTC_018944, partial [Scirpophaga incertulas]